MTQQKEDLLEKAADVAEAVEQNLTKEEEASLGKPSGAKNLIHVITSVTALVAALGAFMKTCDHTLTRNAYNTLSESISKIEDEQKKNHEDLLKLQAYLDGMARAPITSTSVTSTTASTVDAGAPVPSPSPSPSPKLLGKNPEFNFIKSMGRPDLAYMDSTSAVPTVHVAETPAKPPSFDKIDK